MIEDAMIMIDAARLRRGLADELAELHREMRQQSGFEALTTSAAMLALGRVIRAIDAAALTEEQERREYERLRRKFG